MFCIAAFIVLAVISIFSASHRKLAKQALSCTLHRVTLRPCDSSFKEETKNKILSHVANKTPRLVKTADIGIEVASFLLVIFTVWSLIVTVESGLNLFVWGTCNPSNASSCSLSSESCSIDQVKKSFWELTMEGKPYQWFINEAQSFGNTIANIPTRLQKWEATNYLPKNATYYQAKDSAKKTALEITDPGCSVCARLFKNIKEASFDNKYNLTYIAYPIKKPGETDEYKFPNSYTITKYLESLKINPLNNQTTPTDWQILERVFTWKDDSGIAYQVKLNSLMNTNETISLLRTWLKDIGYSQLQINQIEMDANSQEIANIIKENSRIVENNIKTVSIPTIIFDGHRHEGLVKTNDLN
ncbi:MAG: hypothetical protein PWQ10_418 [Patescibacteria group bacterium]|nr:hypothetical protein [Patescibacteria group bacterium]